jgi:hypothetical protein
MECEMNTFIPYLLRIDFVLHEESQIEPTNEEGRQQSQVLLNFKNELNEV